MLQSLAKSPPQAWEIAAREWQVACPSPGLAKATALCALFFCIPSFGGTVQTLDSQSYEGAVAFSSNNTVEITLPGPKTVRVPLTNLSLATFATKRFDPLDFGLLSEDWAATDIGEVSIPGAAGQSNGTFALRVAAADIGGTADRLHFVWHPLRGGGEIAVRVLGLEAGDLEAKTGVMIRETLQPNARFAFAQLTADGKARLHSRAQAGGEAVRTEALDCPLPCWLKLARSNALFIAYCSADGVDWRELGRSEIGGTEDWQAGLALSSHSDFSVAWALLDKVRLTLPGLTGEYFADESFQARRFRRIDPEVTFRWGLGGPEPSLPVDYFSVRWTGQLTPRFSEDYTFHVDADDEADLWIDERKVRTVGYKEGRPRAEAAVPLIAGRRYGLKLEFREGGGSASVRLGWSSASQEREIIPSSCLWTSFEVWATNRSSARQAGSERPGYSRGILLRNGTFIAATVDSVSDRGVRFSYHGQAPREIPAHRVARISFRAPAHKTPARPVAGQTGVLLREGDFFAGEVRSVERDLVRLSSVLYGLRTFNLESEVMAIVLNDMTPSSASHEMRLSNDSRLRFDSFAVEEGLVLVNEEIMGPFAVPEGAVVEIRSVRRPGH